MKWPRRASIPHMTPAELAIREAMLVIETAGCDVLLTDAVILLGQARDKVADYVDKMDPEHTEIETSQPSTPVAAQGQPERRYTPEEHMLGDCDCGTAASEGTSKEKS